MKTACTLSPSISFPRAARRPLSTPPEKETTMLDRIRRSASSIVPSVLRLWYWSSCTPVFAGILFPLQLRSCSFWYQGSGYKIIHFPIPDYKGDRIGDGFIFYAITKNSGVYPAGEHEGAIGRKKRIPNRQRQENRADARRRYPCSPLVSVNATEGR